MQLYLIRHAQSENNARGQTQRVEDPRLTGLGHEQARRLADRVASLGLTHLITSPFLRALQTTDHLRHASGLTPEVRVEWHEKGGCVAGIRHDLMIGRAGMTRSRIASLFPAYTLAAEIDGNGWWGGKPMESETAARERARRVLATLCAEFGQSDQRVACVTHGDFLLLLFRSFHPRPLNLCWNASVTRVAVSGDSMQLELYSCTEHLPNYLVTW